MAITFGLRINGIREGGRPYHSWTQAKEALFRRVNSHVVQLQRQALAEANSDGFWRAAADKAGKAEGELIAMVDRLKRQTPREDFHVDLPSLGDPHNRHVRYAITREPF